MSGKLTPGPWDKQREASHGTYNGGYHEPDLHNAFHHGMDTVYNIMEDMFPDFNVSKAAPEMLTLAENVIGFCVALREDHDCWEKHLDAGLLFAHAKTAIAKAKGTT